MTLPTLGAIFVSSILMCLYPAVKPIAQANEHDTRRIIHPCGNPNTDLKHLTGFMTYRWNAKWADLSDRDTMMFLEHYNLAPTDIVKIRIFTSKAQPRLGVVAARKFTNYLDGKPLVELYCVVKLSGQFILDMEAEKLAEILTPGSGT